MTTTATFDLVLGSLFPLALLLVGYRLRNQFFSWSEISSLLFPGSSRPASSGIYSLDRAFSAYTQYLKLSYRDVQRMRASYRSLGRTHKNLAHKIGYSGKLEKLWEVTSMNATLTEEIADLATKEHPELKRPSGIQEATAADLARVRESLKHFVRDWSLEGSNERKRIFDPILNVLSQVDPSERLGKKVLVPGSGLGRLAWEISEIGFDTTANELSSFMTLAMRYLLSPHTTQKVDQHKIRPYAHWFSHQRTTENLFRSVSFPDVVPRLKENFHLLEQDFLKIPTTEASASRLEFWSTSPETSQSSGSAFDYVVTLFFIDTSFNVLATMAQIYALLKPGGRWINLGPLLWPGGGQCQLELSLEEVLSAAEELGFTFGERNQEAHPNPLEAQRTVECEYTGDPRAMMRWSYKAEFWVAQKPASS